jgi:Zn-dependent peptidase ImmA (M78 family)
VVDDATIGVRLQTARRLLGLTQTEVGQKLGMVTSTVSAIEAGKRSVSGVELYRFAEVYKRPLSFFLDEGGPQPAPGFQYLFREADEQILDRASIIKLEQLAADYRLLEDLVDAVPLPLPPDYSSFQFRTAADAETLAEMERARLGLGEAPIKDIQDLLDEQVGIRAFIVPVVAQSWSGVVVRDQTGRPCVAVNSKGEPYRRNFDFGHEYGHVLAHLGRKDRPEAYVDMTSEHGRQHPDERFANAFAAAFLMPRRAVLARVDRAMQARGGDFTDHDLVHLAMHFGVSGQAMSLRLVSLGRMPRRVHDDLWQGTTFKALAQMLGYRVGDPDAFYDASVILPPRFRYLAFRAYRDGIISLSKLAELLREDPFELRSRLESAHWTAVAVRHGVDPQS